MSQLKLSGDASGTGIVTVAAPNTNSTYTVTLPAAAGTLVNDTGGQTVQFALGSASTPSLTFTGDTNTGVFSSGADTVNFATGGTERMRINSSGNVGIGTTSPTAFHFGKVTEIANTATAGATSDNQELVVKSSNRNAFVYIVAKNTETSTLGFGDGDNQAVGAIAYDHTNNYMAFTANAAERMRITSAGNVGIGTSSPDALFHAYTSSGKVATFGANVNNNGNYIVLGGTVSTPNWVIANNMIIGGELGFGQTSANGGTTIGSSYALTILNGGNVLVGYASNQGAYKLQVNSQIFATSATIATSDGRYKENVTPLTGALDIVKALNPVQFEWKQHPVHNFDRSCPTVGFIAQEVQQVLADKPYLNSIIKANECTIQEEVKDEEGNVVTPAVKEDFYGIAEGNMIAILTKALQEAIGEIETLKTKVAALEAKGA